jgi:RND family efflux transporter MFP subunit
MPAPKGILPMTTKVLSLLAAATIITSCARPEIVEEGPGATEVTGTLYTVRDTMIEVTLDASGAAEPMQRATLATRLLGTVVEVLVREGDAVAEGQVLARLDARDLAAKGAQVAASLAEAEAVRADATAHAVRIRALFADSAATRAQLDAVETGLARADAGVRAARAAGAEVAAMTTYATIRAPFAGTISRRFVDPGSFAAPGTPIVSIEDASRLRVRVTAPPDAAAGLRRGQSVAVVIEGRPATARIEGVVPAAGGNLHTVNAIVDNRDHAFLSGSAASLAIPRGQRPALLIPAAAIRREGDLTGVLLRTPQGDVTRWVRIAQASGDLAEVASGLRAGDQIVVPLTGPATSSDPKRGR